MNVVLRGTIVILAVSSMVILMGLALGQMIRTKVIVDIYMLEGRTYQVSIRDRQRAFELLLVGAHCFESLPPSVTEVFGDGWFGIMESQFELVTHDQPAEALASVRCR